MELPKRKKPKILIVDDESYHTKFLEVILEEEGYETDSANNGLTAIQKAKSENICLVLLDLMLPKMDGYEVITRLKREISTRDIPIIFTSANTDESSYIKGIELGALDYFRKPFNRYELILKIRNYLKMGQLECDLKRELQERKQVEEELIQSETRYRSIIEDQTEFVVRYLPDGTRTFVNSFYCKYMNKSYEEMIGTSFFSQFPEDQKEEIKTTIQSLTPENPVHMGEYKIILSSGNVIWQSWIHRALFDTEECRTEIQSVGRDISDIKRSKESVRIISEVTAGLTGAQFFNSLVSNMVEILNVDFAFVGEWNKDNPEIIRTSSVCRNGEIIENFKYELTDTPCTNVLGKELCMYPDDIQNKFPKDIMLRDMGFESYAGIPLFGKNILPLGLLVVLHSRPLENPELVKSLLMAFSVRASAEMERKKNDEKLLQSVEMFRLSFSHASIGKAMADLKGKFIWINDAFCNISGYSEEELQQRTWHDITHAKYLNETNTNFKKLFDGEIPNCTLEQEIMQREGHNIWINLNIVLIRNSDDQPQYLYADIIDITERKENEKALQQAADIVRNTQVGIMIYQMEDLSDDRSLVVTAANPAFEKLIGVKPNDVIGKSIDENFPGLRSIGIPQKYAEVIRSKQSFELENIIYGDNRVIEGVFSIKAFPLPGNQLGVSLENISEKKKFEQALIRNEKRLEMAMNVSGAGVYDYVSDSDSQAYYSKRWSKILGYSNREIPPQKQWLEWYFNLIHPEDRPLVEEAYKNFIIGRSKKFCVEYRIRKKSQKWIYVQDICHAINRDKKGKVQRIIGTLLDISNRKNAEEELKKSEERFQSLIEQATDSMFLADYAGNITGVNQRTCKGLGYSRDELLKMKVTDLDAVYKEQDQIERLWSGLVPGKPVIIEAVHKRKDGSTFPVEINIASIELKTGPAILGFARDITQRKEAEKLQHKWENIFKNSGWGIVIGSTNSKKLEMMNQTFAEMHGYTVEELEGKSMEMLFAPESKPFIPDYIRMAHEKGHHTFESNHIHKDGTIFPVFTDVTVVKDDDGNDLYRVVNVQDITELKVAVNALKESEERFRKIFFTSPDIITISRLKDNIIVDINDECTKVLGYNREEIIGKTALEMNLWENLEPQKEFMEGLRKDGFVNNTEFGFRKKKGQVFTALLSAALIQLNGITHVLTVATNIEDIKRFQESLKESETKFRLLADYTFDWEYWIDPDRNYIYVSPSCERITGYKADEFISRPEFFFDIVHPDYVEEVRKHYYDDIEEELYFTMDFMIIDKDGNEKWITHHCSPVFDDRGNYLGRRGNNRDITVRKKAEQELHKLTTAIEQSNSAIVITDTEGCIEYVNPYFEKLTGYSADEALGAKPSLMKSGKTDPKVYEILWKTISSGKVWEGEFINRKKNKKEFIEHAIITPVKNENNKIVNYIAVKQDITEQKLVADTLKESETKFKNIFNNSTDGIMISGYDNKIMEVNEAFTRNFGFSIREVIGSYTTDFIGPNEAELLLARLERLKKSGKVSPIQLKAITKSGKPIQIEVDSRNIGYKGQKAVLSIIRDITERKEIQRRILNTIIETEEKERSRFAKDLHDGLGPLLSTIKLYINALTTVEEASQKMIAINNSQIAIDEAIVSIKEIANNISPHILRDFGIVLAINSYVKKINETKEIMLVFEADVDKRPDENIELSLFRIVTELIDNTLKYAQAQNVNITLAIDKGLLTFDYSDDGIGFDVKKLLNKPTGRGLSNIVNRTKSLNGDIKFSRAKGMGMNVKIEIHINN